MLKWYSERGMVNAWLTSFDKAGNTNSLLMKSLKGAFPILNDSTELSLLKWLDLTKEVLLEIYIEPSLSEFGNPDAVILIGDETGKNRQVLFIEAKMCTFQESSGKPGTVSLTRNSSRILHELFMKAVFYKELKTIKNSDVEGFEARVYAEDKKKRKIGRNKFVLELAWKIMQCDKAAFIALTTDLVSSPVNLMQAQACNIAIKNNHKGVFNSDNRQLFILPWQSIYAVSDASDDLRRAFDENLDSFSFSRETVPNRDDFIWKYFENQGLSVVNRESSFTLNFKDSKRALFTCNVKTGFGNITGLLLKFTNIQVSRKRKNHNPYFSIWRNDLKEGTESDIHFRKKIEEAVQLLQESD